MRSLALTILVCLAFANVAYSLDKERDCKCRINTEKRIINGRLAGQAAYPWQVSVMSFKSRGKKNSVSDEDKINFHECGGVILNSQWILTAGHCGPNYYDGKYTKNYRVGFGSNDLVQIYDEKKYIEVAESYTPFEYLRYRNIDDISLIKLKTPLNFSESVAPACLETDYNRIYEGILQMTGWGSTRPVIFDQQTGLRSGRQNSRFLRAIDVHDRRRCRHREEICVENEVNGQTGCEGDDGGPLLWTRNGKTTVAGISKGNDQRLMLGNQKIQICNEFQRYLRLSEYIDFIAKYIGNDYCV